MSESNIENRRILKNVLLATQEFLEQVQGLRVVTNQDDLVVRCRAYAMQESAVGKTL